MAGSLGGFSEAIIDAACSELETAEVAPYENKMPTLGVLLKSCQKQAQVVNTNVQKWCGRCDHGVVGTKGNYRRCECCCPLCDNSGIEIVRRDGSHFESNRDFKEFREARRCACRKSA